MPDHACNTTRKLDTGTADPDNKLIPIIIKAQPIITHTEVAPNHVIGSTEDMTGVAHDTHTPPLTTINPGVTHHITDLLHIEALPLTPEITTDHTLNQLSHPQEKVCINPLLIPGNHEAYCISLGTSE